MLCSNTLSGMTASWPSPHLTDIDFAISLHTSSSSLNSDWLISDSIETSTPVLGSIKLICIIPLGITYRSSTGGFWVFIYHRLIAQTPRDVFAFSFPFLWLRYWHILLLLLLILVYKIRSFQPLIYLKTLMWLGSWCLFPSSVRVHSA